MDIFNNYGAEFSPCRKYRYCLWRIWNPDKPMIMFIGLNPSKADETNQDPTITRVMGFAKDWGYGGVYMLNIFAFVTPYPHELKQCPDPVGQNDDWLNQIYQLCERVVFAWGDFKEARERSKMVIQMFPDAYALIINKNGTPRHPLYVPGNTVPVKFNSK